LDYVTIQEVLVASLYARICCSLLDITMVASICWIHLLSGNETTIMHYRLTWLDCQSEFDHGKKIVTSSAAVLLPDFSCTKMDGEE